MKPIAILPLFLLTAGCATADFADGVSNFGAAATALDSSETALAKADQQAQLDQWYARAAAQARTSAAVDFTACRATPYKPGSCQLTVSGGPAPLTPVESSLPAIKAYSAQLAAVVADKSCASLKSDAGSLATEVGNLAKLAGAPAAAAGPVATIAATLGCWQIARAQLRILKTATAQADPLIQELVPLIRNKDRNMAADVARIRTNQLQLAVTDYQGAGRTTLPQLVQMASAVDTARTGNPEAQILEARRTAHRPDPGSPDPQGHAEAGRRRSGGLGGRRPEPRGGLHEPDLGGGQHAREEARLLIEGTERWPRCKTASTQAKRR